MSTAEDVMTYRRERHIALYFSATAPQLAEQLAAQGYALTWCGQAQQDADAITRLALRNMMSESMAGAARQRLFKRILRDAEPLPSTPAEMPADAATVKAIARSVDMRTCAEHQQAEPCETCAQRLTAGGL